MKVFILFGMKLLKTFKRISSHNGNVSMKISLPSKAFFELEKVIAKFIASTIVIRTRNSLETNKASFALALSMWFYEGLDFRTRITIVNKHRGSDSSVIFSGVWFVTLLSQKKVL